MPRWQDVMLAVAKNADEHYDNLKIRLGERLGLDRPLKITAFRTFGTAEKLLVRGRVLQDRGVRSPRDDDSTWDNLLNMYRRLESHEVPYARVLARYGDIAQEIVANEEGFFEAWLPAATGGWPVATGKRGPELGTTPALEAARTPENAPDAAARQAAPGRPGGQAGPQGPNAGGPQAPARPPSLGAPIWRNVDIELVHPRPQGDGPVRATCHVMVPPPSASFGVISDIDDTVIHTDVGHFVRMARTVFLGNARMRLPFEGVAAFYRALDAGASGHDRNPLFYVSNSPWNMYDIFSDFFQMQDIPAGPVLILRDWGASKREPDQGPLHARAFKTAAVRAIMDTYPDLPFILVGDSGEKDPEVYDETVEHARGRVLAVYIRNVSRRPERVAAIEGLAEKVLAAGSTMILAQDTLPLAEHAAAQGWIASEAVPRIAEAKAADEAPPTPLEQLLGQPEKEPGPTVVIGTEAQADGGVGQALEAGDEKEQKPPTVVVKGDEGGARDERNPGSKAE